MRRKILITGQRTRKYMTMAEMIKPTTGDARI